MSVSNEKYHNYFTHLVLRSDYNVTDFLQLIDDYNFFSVVRTMIKKILEKKNSFIHAVYQIGRKFSFLTQCL